MTNDKDERDDAVRRPYETPLIRELGRLVDLTGGQSVPGADDNEDGGTVPV